MEHQEIEEMLSKNRGNSSIIFDSTYEAIQNFIEDKELKDLIELHLYITGTACMQRPPTDLEKVFIEEFFTNEAWADYLQRRKREENGRQNFFYVPPFDLPTIQGILAFEINLLTSKELKKRDLNKKKVENIKIIKKELENALDNSVFDGIFDKVDGFSNIYEVLIKHNLVKERED